MNLIVCLDDKNGMGFHGRRQSADRVLAQHMLKLTNGARLWMSPDSLSFFKEMTENMVADPKYWIHACDDDYCFAEQELTAEALKKVRSIIVYRWNRAYPSDIYFPTEELTRRKRRVEDEFTGSSHARITQERYCI